MSKEVRSIFLVVLTLVIYAVSIALQPGGSLVFPFPLNPFFFFAVAIYFVFLNYKKKIISAIVASVAAFGALSSKVLWEVILSVENLESFFKHPYIYWFHLLFGLSIIVWALTMLSKQKDHLAKVLTGLGAVAFGIGYVQGEDFIVFVAYGILAFSALFKPTHKPFNLLWLLLIILESTKWINFWLN